VADMTGRPGSDRSGVVGDSCQRCSNPLTGLSKDGDAFAVDVRSDKFEP